MLPTVLPAKSPKGKEPCKPTVTLRVFEPTKATKPTKKTQKGWLRRFKKAEGSPPANTTNEKIIPSTDSLDSDAGKIREVIHPPSSPDRVNQVAKFRAERLRILSSAGSQGKNVNAKKQIRTKELDEIEKLRMKSSFDASFDAEEKESPPPVKTVDGAKLISTASLTCVPRVPFL